uniref:Uncharacterized protein n=1 Tax=Chromera velia CCMP2878 TaxID=1169474 RepID=A0A0G4GXA8_9ALVE|eukprot:Cvel_23799.t1-p1 / transcript=Cvel_23799.t1 / gene=Cvel_23799 / organism=Chromera_velia_CCMP2878 / gene_product=hypothetical protein / transcript_product=hypothetical protein / location=Cvel_scaffold2498:13942-14685(+) / protein_length=248 / sequence_SO=supercontig / SO=protein_coding / is_pseudo=false
MPPPGAGNLIARSGPSQSEHQSRLQLNALFTRRPNDGNGRLASMEGRVSQGPEPTLGIGPSLGEDLDFGCGGSDRSIASQFAQRSFPYDAPHGHGSLGGGVDEGGLMGSQFPQRPFSPDALHGHGGSEEGVSEGRLMGSQFLQCSFSSDALHRHGSLEKGVGEGGPGLMGSQFLQRSFSPDALHGHGGLGRGVDEGALIEFGSSSAHNANPPMFPPPSSPPSASAGQHPVSLLSIYNQREESDPEPME